MIPESYTEHEGRVSCPKCDSEAKWKTTSKDINPNIKADCPSCGVIPFPPSYYPELEAKIKEMAKKMPF